MASFHPDRAARKPYTRPPRRSADDQWVHDMAEGAHIRAGPQAHRPAGSAVPSAKLVVTNLHYEISPADLTAIFGQIGTLVSEPRIRYDRSGRSSGSAFVSFETTAEATRAKKQFDGILARGQPMSIAFDVSMPRVRSASAPTSLLSRIQKGPLLNRLSGSKDDSALKAPRGGVGPIRTRAPRGGDNTKTAPAGPRPPKKGPKVPKTAAELDKELDAFMGDSSTVTPPAAAAQDVEMAA